MTDHKPIKPQKDLRNLVKTLEDHSDEDVQASIDALKALGGIEQAIGEMAELALDVRTRAIANQRPHERI